MVSIFSSMKVNGMSMRAGSSAALPTQPGATAATSSSLPRLYIRCLLISIGVRLFIAAFDAAFEFFGALLAYRSGHGGSACGIALVAAGGVRGWSVVGGVAVAGAVR